MISFDRFLSVKVNNWNKIYLNSKRAILVGLLPVFILALLNFNILFTFGVDIITVNNTQLIQCYSTDLDPKSKWMDVWGTVYSIFYSLIPFVLLLLSSLLLIYEINKKTRLVANHQSVSRHENNKSLNKTIVLIAILFIIMTSPGAIVTSFLNAFLQSSGDLGNFVIEICDCITFSFHALNFLILLLTNKRFAKEVKNHYLGQISTNTNLSPLTKTH